MPNGEPEGGELISRPVFGLLMIAQENIILRRFARPMLFECDAAINLMDGLRNILRRKNPIEFARVKSTYRSLDGHLTALRQQMSFARQLNLPDIAQAGIECEQWVLAQRRKLRDWWTEHAPDQGPIE